MAATGTTSANFIGGEWVEAESGERFESVSPATGEVLGSLPRSGAADVDRAVRAAAAAFADWRLVPAPGARRHRVPLRRAAARAQG